MRGGRRELLPALDVFALWLWLCNGRSQHEFIQATGHTQSWVSRVYNGRSRLQETMAMFPNGAPALRSKSQRKLSDEQVSAMRRMHRNGVGAWALCELFDVHHETARRILSRRTYKEVA